MKMPLTEMLRELLTGLCHEDNGIPTATCGDLMQASTTGEASRVIRSTSKTISVNVNASTSEPIKIVVELHEQGDPKVVVRFLPENGIHITYHAGNPRVDELLKSLLNGHASTAAITEKSAANLDTVVSTLKTLVS